MNINGENVQARKWDRWYEAVPVLDRIGQNG